MQSGTKTVMLSEIVQNTTRTAATQYQMRSLQRGMEASKAEIVVSLEKKTALIAQLKKKNERKNRIEELKRRCACLEKANAEERKAILEERIQLKRASAELIDKSREVVEAKKSMISLQQTIPFQKRRERWLYDLRAARVLKLITHLSLIYPIKSAPDNSHLTIADVPLPLSLKDIPSFEEQEISTAFGFIAHLTYLIAKYLQVPLRYTFILNGSRSAVRDPTAEPVTDFPLYLKGVDRSKFETALTFLNRNILQLLHARGVYPGNSRNPLSYLEKLFAREIDL